MCIRDRHIDDQGHVGQHARQAIVDEHEQQHDDHTDDAGANAGLNRLLAQRGPHLARAFDTQRHGQTAELELRRQPLCLIQRKVAGDDAAIVNGGVDLGARNDLFVKNNRQKAPLVGGRVLAKNLASLFGQREGDKVLP